MMIRLLLILSLLGLATGNCRSAATGSGSDRSGANGLP